MKWVVKADAAGEDSRLFTAEIRSLLPILSLSIALQARPLLAAIAFTRTNNRASVARLPASRRRIGAASDMSNPPERVTTSTGNTGTAPIAW